MLSLRLRAAIIYHRWYLWLIVPIILHFSLSLWILPFSRPAWMDEVMIISSALNTFPEPPSMSVVQLSNGVKPYSFLWGHSLVVRPFLAIFGVSLTAARLPILLSHLIATFLLWYILQSLSIRPILALTTALLFMTDSIISRSMYSARADILVFVWTFASILLIVRSAKVARPMFLISLVGVCVTIALATWPSAPLVLGLIPVSLLWIPGYRASRSLLTHLFWLGLSALISLSILLLLSLWPDFQGRIASFSAAVSWLPEQPVTSVADFIQRLASQFYVRQPWMYGITVLAIVLTLIFRSWRGLTCLALALPVLLITAFTHLYHFRYIYVIPIILFMLAFSSEKLLDWFNSHHHYHWQKWHYAFLILCVIGNFSVEIVLRAVVVSIHKEAFNYERVENFLNDVLQPGDRVFGDFPLFYAVESRGGHLISWFRVIHEDKGISYEAIPVQQAGLSEKTQVLTADPACIDFLQSIDIVAIRYDEQAANDLSSADGSVRFAKVSELPPTRSPWADIVRQPDRGYDFILYRRISDNKNANSHRE